PTASVPSIVALGDAVLRTLRFAVVVTPLPMAIGGNVAPCVIAVALGDFAEMFPAASLCRHGVGVHGTCREAGVRVACGCGCPHLCAAGIRRRRRQEDARLHGKTAPSRGFAPDWVISQAVRRGGATASGSPRVALAVSMRDRMPMEQ